MKEHAILLPVEPREQAFSPPLSQVQDKPKAGEILRHAAWICIIALLLHLVWEFAQCSVFYRHGSYDASWRGMLRAGLGDVLLTWGVYGVVAASSRRWLWAARPWSRRQLLVYATSALALAIMVEARALAASSWAYTDSMPLIPGLNVGLLPVVQLLLLFPLTLVVVGRLSGGHRADPTEVTRRRYDRIAPVYDILETLMEFRFRPLRRSLWERVDGTRILEVGIGTGKNLDFHPTNRELVGIDLSSAMLARARRRASKLGSTAELKLADVQRLPFDDNSFDSIVATFVFCSVPDALSGLTEVRRVLKPQGTLFLLEHVVSGWRPLATLMRFLDPIPVAIWGAHIDRDTVEEVRRAGFEVTSLEQHTLDVLQTIIAVIKPRPES